MIAHPAVFEQFDFPGRFEFFIFAWRSAPGCVSGTGLGQGRQRESLGLTPFTPSLHTDRSSFRTFAFEWLFGLGVWNWGGCLELGGCYVAGGRMS